MNANPSLCFDHLNKRCLSIIFDFLSIDELITISVLSKEITSIFQGVLISTTVELFPDEIYEKYIIDKPKYQKYIKGNPMYEKYIISTTLQDKYRDHRHRINQLQYFGVVFDCATMVISLSVINEILDQFNKNRATNAIKSKKTIKEIARICKKVKKLKIGLNISNMWMCMKLNESRYEGRNYDEKLFEDQILNKFPEKIVEFIISVPCPFDPRDRPWRGIGGQKEIRLVLILLTIFQGVAT